MPNELLDILLDIFVYVISLTHIFCIFFIYINITLCVQYTQGDLSYFFLSFILLWYHCLVTIQGLGLWAHHASDALYNNGTWELVLLAFGKFVVCCRCIFSIKVGSYGTIDSLKAHLMFKGYTQIFCLHHGDTFSPMEKMAYVCHSHGCSSTVTSLSTRCQKCISY